MVPLNHVPFLEFLMLILISSFVYVSLDSSCVLFLDERSIGVCPLGSRWLLREPRLGIKAPLSLSAFVGHLQKCAL